MAARPTGILTRAGTFVNANRQNFFNIGSSFLVFMFAGQVYGAKIEKLALAQDVAQRDYGDGAPCACINA